MDPVIEQVQHTCGHLFCRSCAEGWIIQGKDTCPLRCGSEFNADSLSPCILISVKQILAGLDVECPQCTLTVKRGDLSDHLQKKCKLLDGYKKLKEREVKLEQEHIDRKNTLQQKYHEKEEILQQKYDKLEEELVQMVNLQLKEIEEKELNQKDEKSNYISEEILNAMVDRFYSCAINLQNPALYAKLCADFCNDKEGIGEENTKQFKRFLLIKCQTEFEKKVELTHEEVEDKEFMWRKKKLGNIIFIGELYLQGIVSEKIIHIVIVRILFTSPPDDVEFLCLLLSTIGCKLEHEKSKKYFNLYIEKMKCLTDISPHSKLMIDDLINMRENGWISNSSRLSYTLFE